MCMCMCGVCACVAAAAKRTVACNSSSNMTATLFTRVFCTRIRVDCHECALFHTQFVFTHECLCVCVCVSGVMPLLLLLLQLLLVAFVVTFNSYTMANSFHVPPIFIHKTTT